MKKRFLPIFMIVIFIVSMFEVNINIPNVYAAEINAKGIPASNELWRYVGSNGLSEDAGTIWVRGNAYKKASKGISINTSSSDYQNANEALKKDDFLSKTKICIIYIPNCPYAKTLLPLYQEIAKNVSANVLLVDIYKYGTGSLLPYYDVANKGSVSPIVLYVKSDGSLAGESGVHSTADFVRILKEAGYSNASDSDEDSSNVYSSEQQYKDEVLKETNRQRLANGLLPLSVDTNLEEAANTRSEEIVEKMSHTRPNGELYTSLIDMSNYSYLGENIAGGPTVATPYAVVNAWMNSKPHRANILSDKFTSLAVGHYSNTGDGYKDYWVQLFSAPRKTVNSISVDSSDSISVEKGTPLSDLNLNVILTYNDNTTATIPLIDEMTTGYDKDKSGEQKVTINYGKYTKEIIVNVGKVEPQELTADMVKISDSEYTYDGQPKTPEVVVSNSTGEYTLLKDYSYTISYEDNINAGTAKVTVKGKGNYTGTVTEEFTILPKDISSATIYGVEENYEYTGKEITPTVTVKDNSKLLYEGTDFNVEYKDNVGEMIAATSSEPAKISDKKATIEISGTGNYTGTLTTTFGFTINSVHAVAEKLAFLLSPYPTYDSWVEANNKYGTNELVKLLKILQSQINRGYSDKLNEIISCTLCPEAGQRLSAFYKAYNEYVNGIKSEINTDATGAQAISNVKLSGIDASIKEDNTSVTLKVKDYDEKLKLDNKTYDEYNIVPLDIDLTMDGEKANLTVPVTITMDIPTGFKEGDNIAILHYENGSSSDPTELNSIVDWENGTISFSVDSFSPFAMVKKLSTYDIVQDDDVSANNPENTGVSFGTEDDKGAESPENISIERISENSINVSWDKVESDDTYSVLGYDINYSTNEDMSDVKTVRVDSDKNSVKIENLDPNKYYITVSTISKTPWSDEVLGTSKVNMIEITKVEEMSASGDDSNGNTGDENQDDSSNGDDDIENTENEELGGLPDEDVVIPEYVNSILDDTIIYRGNGDGQTTDSAVKLVVQDVSGDKFNEFADKLSKLETTLLNYSNENDLSIYNVKIQDSEDSSEEFFVEIIVSNKLENYDSINSKLEEILKPDSDDEITGDENQGDSSNGDSDDEITGDENQDGSSNEDSDDEITGDENQSGSSNGDSDDETTGNEDQDGSNSDSNTSSSHRRKRNKNKDESTSSEVNSNTEETSNTESNSSDEENSNNSNNDIKPNWIRNSDNTWKLLNGDNPVSGWSLYNGKWYFMNENGIMQTGWKLVNNKWYYLNENGDMSTGWKFVNNRWYYLNEDGDMATGWKLVNNKWYYLNPNGDMAYNTVINGYKLDSSGAWIE